MQDFGLYDWWFITAFRDKLTSNLPGSLFQFSLLGWTFFGKGVADFHGGFFPHVPFPLWRGSLRVTHLRVFGGTPFRKVHILTGVGGFNLGVPEYIYPFKGGVSDDMVFFHPFPSFLTSPKKLAPRKSSLGVHILGQLKGCCKGSPKGRGVIPATKIGGMGNHIRESFAPLPT